MKKRSRRVLILLMSALMVCGAFSLTAFADDHTHKWKTNGEGNVVSFGCTVEGCEYRFWNKITMEAENAYSGVPYDAGNIELTYVDEDLSDEVTLSDPVYLDSEGEELDYIPSEAGDYFARIDLLIKGQKKASMTDAFTLTDFAINVDPDEFIPGGFDSDYIQLIDGNEVINDEDVWSSFEYLSLDSTSSDYTDKEPVNVGHYRVRATLYKITETGIFAIGQATGNATSGEFEIRKLKKADLNCKAYFINDPIALAKIDPEAVQFENLDELKAVVKNLKKEGFISDTGTYGDVVILVPYTDTTVYSPELFGAMTVTYKKNKLTRVFIPGVTILDAGEHSLKVTIKASRNNEKISGNVKVTLDKAEPIWIVEPTDKEGLVFNDRYQELVNPGKAVGGTVYYKLGSGKASTSIPVAKDPGEYVIKYQAKSNNSNYEDGQVGTLKVKIESKEETEPDDLAPGKVTLLTVIKKTSDGAVVTFKRVKDADSYEYVITDKNGKSKTKTVKQKVTKLIQINLANLNKNAKYTVKVRAVKTVDDEKHYGEWSKTVSFKTKK